MDMCLSYLDNIVDFSDTFDEHVSRLVAVLKCIQGAERRLNPEKCLFSAPEIKILAHLVS